MNQLTKAEMESLYPEIYREIYPQVTQAVEELLRSGHSPTKESFDMAVERIIQNSNVEDPWNQEAVATATYGNRPNHNRPGPNRPGPNRPGPNRPGHNHNRPGPHPSRPGRPPYHNHNTLQDIAGILLLNELFGRGYYRPW